MHLNPIGVFDSGIGGLSILKALRHAMPAEHFVYFADTKYNPYGVKSEAFVRERSLSIAQSLIKEHQIKALVVACNTATAAAIELLRLTFPELPIIGVEPALKPAAAVTRSGRVLVLATRGTLASEKFAQLKANLQAEHAASADAVGRPLQFSCVPGDGLAECIEHLSEMGARWQDTPDLIALCAGFITAIGQFDLKNATFDTLVLGCTHYPLVRDVFRSLAGEAVTIVDNAEPVALRTMQLLSGKHAPTEQSGAVIWRSSADEAKLLKAAGYWGLS